MKRIAILLIGVLLVLGACKKKVLDQPDIQNFPEENVWSVAQILDTLAAGTYEFNQEWHKNATLKGFVIADEHSGGNVYSTLYVRGEDGSCISLTRRSSDEGGSEKFTQSYGDHIGCKLYGAVLSTGKYNNPEIRLMVEDPNTMIVEYDKGCYGSVSPINATLTEINEGKYHLDLVKISDVQFDDYRHIYASQESYYTSWPLVDCFGESVVINTSRSANFASDSLPEGKGTLVSIVTRYRDAKQLVIRNTADVNMNGPRCDGQGGDVHDMPYGQVFNSSFGTFMTYSVFGDQVWTIDHNTAKMSGYAGGNHANEDWLISSPVNITGVEHAKVVVNYVAQYNKPIDDDVTLQVSTDYEFGNDPATATWTEMDTRYPNTGGWDDFQDIETSLDAFIGQTVTVAIKFVSTDNGSRTLEVKSIMVEEGEAGGGGGGGGSTTGDGTRENPYTAQDIITLNTQTSDNNKYWVKDYIVAVIDNEYNYVWTNSTDVKSNVVLSSNADTENPDECIPIQLPYGAVRDGLNLADNPGNYKQEVLVYGTLEKYFQKAGVKNVSYAEINGNSYGIEPGGGGTEYFNEVLTTQASFDTFTAYNVEGEQVWTFSSSYGASMSGYASNASHANEDWFISAPIDLTASSNPVLTFEHARGPKNSINVGVNEGYYTVWVSNDYESGDPRNAHWTELEGVVHGTSAWGWVSSGRLAIPEALHTSSCRIAFKYLSIDTASATWEVKNVIVSE